MGEALLGAALRAMATSDAAYTVNRVLANKFGLQDGGIKTNEVTTFSLMLVRLEMIQILAQHSTLPPRAQGELVRRIVAKFFPTRDGAGSGSPRSLPSPSKEDRIADLESVIARELQNTFGRKK